MNIAAVISSSCDRIDENDENSSGGDTPLIRRFAPPSPRTCVQGEGNSLERFAVSLNRTALRQFYLRSRTSLRENNKTLVQTEWESR
jgi:hypothetical protein